jgi:hypothetical protein
MKVKIDGKNQRNMKLGNSSDADFQINMDLFQKKCRGSNLKASRRHR